MIMNPSFDVQLKALWGATAMPFGKEVKNPYRWNSFQQTETRLIQFISLRAWGVVHGPNGVGKSQLMAVASHGLSDKLYRLVCLCHSSLTGSDLLRAICHSLDIIPAFRRSDTVALIHRAFKKLEKVFPLLILDEAQNLSATALEELRLLSCTALDHAAIFGLVLVGDANLLPRLHMGINRSLLSRLGFCLNLQPMNPEQTLAYIDARLREVAIQNSPIEENARQLLTQASAGIPRCVNQLAQLAFQAAVEESSQRVNLQHFQRALDQLPWLAHPETN